MPKRLLLCALLVLVPATAHADPPQKPCEDTEVRCFIRKYWEADDSEALAVARCESGYDPRARNGSHHGLFQLSQRYHEGRAASLGYEWSDMWDPGKNTAVAFDLWKDSGWGPWVCRP